MNICSRKVCDDVNNIKTICKSNPCKIVTSSLYDQSNSCIIQTVINKLINQIADSQDASNNNSFRNSTELTTKLCNKYNSASNVGNSSTNHVAEKNNELTPNCDVIHMPSLLPTALTTNTISHAKTSSSEICPTSFPLKNCMNEELCKPITNRKTIKPFISMLPPKYKNVDIKEIFPDFHPDKPIRFHKLFGLEKPSNLPQIWRGIKRRNELDKKKTSLNELSNKRRKVNMGWTLDIPNSPPPPEMVESDDEIKMTRINKQENLISHFDLKKISDTAPWRHGPAKLWYDMLEVPEDVKEYDFGFKVIENIKEDFVPNKDYYPDEAYLMVTQLQWEDDVIWDGNDVKEEVLGKLYKKNAAGWEPTGMHRTWAAYNKEAKVTSSIIQPSSKLNFQKILKIPAIGSTMTEQCDNSDAWWSILPVENEDLIYGSWEDDVIWDSQSMKKIPEPKILTFDFNDENIIFEIPDEPPKNLSNEKETANRNKEMNKKSRIQGKNEAIAEGEVNENNEINAQDPFNISNDEYYNPKITQGNLFKLNVSGNLIQHSTPAVQLRVPFFPTHMGPFKRSHFHRPPLKCYSHGTLSQPGFHGVSSLLKHLKRKSESREKERTSCGGGEIFFMRTSVDITGKDGELILAEYSEEHPPLLSQVGMATKIKNYYKRKPAKDFAEPEFKYGEIVYAHSSPFLGSLEAGQTIQAFENNLFRAPIYEHELPETDFLIIRTRERYYIREINVIFTVGQELPLYEVPCPKSKKAQNFFRDFIQVHIYRLFWKSKDNPRRIKIEDIKKAFPTHTETSIRRRLNVCAEFKRTAGSESNWWVLKPDFRLPNEDEIQAMVTPEGCCAYYTMLAAEHRLKDAGYGEKSLFAPENDDEDIQLKIDDEIKAAPWNTTRTFISAINGKCLLQLTGVADPTGCGEGFSYVRLPNKPQLYKEEYNLQLQTKKTITGTDADLRRLSLSNAKQLLKKFNIPDSEIKKLSRWEIIDVVRTLSTQQAKAGKEAMSKFARGNRFSFSELQEKYKEECQRLFNLQNSILSSKEILSSDEDSSSEDDSDLEKMGKNLEDILSNKKTSYQLSEEREEMERQELQKFIKGENGADNTCQERDKLTDDSKYSDKILKIYRTFRNVDGKEFSRVETVRNSSVIEAYIKIRKTKSPEYIKQLGTFLDERERDEIKKERRRIQDQLRRIKRNEEKENHFIPKRKLKKDISLLKVKCGACGGIGHMKTNRACPYYEPSSPVQPVQVEMMDHDQKEPYIEEDNLVKVDETKLVISKKLIEHAQELRRKSLVLKFKLPKGHVSKVRRRKTLVSEEEGVMDFVDKPIRTVNRRRTDPIVTFTIIIEHILNRIRNVPDSQPFWHPVNTKKFPDYQNIVSHPMDLQTMRSKLQLKKYESREEFLQDLNQILENSIIYNGKHNIFSLTAQKMVDVCLEEFTKNEDKLMNLEKAINPFLDDNEQVQFSYFLEAIVNENLKTIPESWPFHKPIAKKFLKDYQMLVKNPIDLETILNNIKSHKYQDRQSFQSDVYLLLSNSVTFNGPDSQFTRKAKEIVHACDETLNKCDEQLTKLENAIKFSGFSAQTTEQAHSAVTSEFPTQNESAISSDSDDSTNLQSDSADDEMEYVNITGDENSDDQGVIHPPSFTNVNTNDSIVVDDSYDPSEFLMHSDFSLKPQCKEINGDTQKGLNLSDSDDDERDLWF